MNQTDYLKQKSQGLKWQVKSLPNGLAFYLFLVILYFIPNLNE